MKIYLLWIIGRWKTEWEEVVNGVDYIANIYLDRADAEQEAIDLEAHGVKAMIEERVAI